MKIPLQYYQLVLLEQAFYRRGVPIDTIAWYMHAALPHEYSGDTPFGKTREPLDKEKF